MPTKKSSKNTKFTFEQALDELDTIVETMEAGGLSLEDALKQFERGVKLTKECQKTLKAAEQKVNILLEKNGKTELADFTVNDDG